jgi:hypothetical protein
MGVAKTADSCTKSITHTGNGSESRARVWGCIRKDRRL